MTALFLAGLWPVGAARADNIACATDGSGNDTCTISYPNVLAPSTVYPNLVFGPGDTVSITASGCLQTGGSGDTWKRYVDPSGNNSDHLYHGLISIPGVTQGLVRLSTVVGRTDLPASTGGVLTLGYEDDNYEDNGYYSHDNGNNNQCSSTSGPFNNNAQIQLTIHRVSGLFSMFATYGQCQQVDFLHETCHIDRPDVTHDAEPFPGIQFRAGDTVVVTAGGCVQTGGSGDTWKSYVSPSGDNSDHLYHGLISIPTATNGFVRLSTIIGTTLNVTQGGILSLGYEDDEYDDNGYWNHDNGNNNQCLGVGPAYLDLEITHSIASGQISVDGIEVVQAIQDVVDSVHLVAGKTTFARVYLSSPDALPGPITANLIVNNTANGATATIPPVAPLTLVQGATLRARRESWTGSLNFPITGNLIAAGSAGFQLGPVTLATGAVLSCTGCNNIQVAGFLPAVPLRLKIIGLTYLNNVNVVQAPQAADYNLLESWLLRAYPTASLQLTTDTVASNNGQPFTCTQANAQLAALRGLDVQMNGVDPRTHYLSLVTTTVFYMRGCASGVPASAPDPTTVASSPTGNPAGPGSVPVNVTGDTDASFGDWYGGHELGHTFGRLHPGFCNGNSADDPSFPYPNGQISDSVGTDTGLDVGDGAQGLPLLVLAGASHFDIMTYCNQPQWLSAYAYEGVRLRLAAENAAGGGSGGGRGDGSPGPGSRSAARYVHVVASVNVSRKRGDIRYVNPVAHPIKQYQVSREAELQAYTHAGKLIASYAVQLREDSDVPPGEDREALVDATIPLTRELATIHLVLDRAVLAKFSASQRKPPAIEEVRLLELSADERDRQPRFELKWTPVQLPGDQITYSVQWSTDSHVWQAIAVGLTGPSLALSPSQARRKLLRVIATNGYVDSEPALAHAKGQVN